MSVGLLGMRGGGDMPSDAALFCGSFCPSMDDAARHRHANRGIRLCIDPSMYMYFTNNQRITKDQLVTYFTITKNQLTVARAQSYTFARVRGPNKGQFYLFSSFCTVILIYKY